MYQYWKWLVPLFCLLVLTCIGGFLVLLLTLMKSSYAYSGAVSRAKSSPAVIAALGTPVKEGFFLTGNISESDGSGSANLAIPIAGPRGAANIYVSASRSLGKWHFDNLVVQIDKTKEQIDVLETNRSPAAMPVQK